MDNVKQAIAECATIQAKNPGFATFIDFAEVLTAFECLEQANQELAQENADLRQLPTLVTVGKEMARG